MGRRLTPLAGKILSVLEEAGSENIRTLEATFEENHDEFRAAVDELVSMGLAECAHVVRVDWVYKSTNPQDWEQIELSGSELDLMTTESGIVALRT